VHAFTGKKALRRLCVRQLQQVIINNDSKSDDLAWLETMPYKGSITYIMVYSNDLVRAFKTLFFVHA
jgi:hypothetical protein